MVNLILHAGWFMLVTDNQLHVRHIAEQGNIGEHFLTYPRLAVAIQFLAAELAE
jgi:hypothetical protein